MGARVADDQHPDHGAEVLGIDDREMIVTALKMALIPEIRRASEEYFSKMPAPKPSRWLLVATAVIGSIVFIGTMLTATLWGVSAIRIASTYQEKLYELYYNQTALQLREIQQQQEITKAYVIQVDKSLAAAGIQDPDHP